jgi:hypothetical protein
MRFLRASLRHTCGSEWYTCASVAQHVGVSDSLMTREKPVAVTTDHLSAVRLLFLRPFIWLLILERSSSFWALSSRVRRRR